jgi:AcrR family transcriptional regulator
MDGIGGARPARHETHARPAGELAVRLGHEGGAALLAADHESDPPGMGMKAVQHRQVALARHAEGVRHALGDQAFDKQVAGDAVLEQAYRHIREAERALHLLDLKPADAVRRLVEFTWNYYLDHPEFLTLLNSANLHKARHLQGSQRVREMNSPLIAMLGEILERGRKEGSFRGGIDPVQLYVSIAGLAYFYLSNSFTLSSIFGRDLLSAKARSERLSHMCDVILGYVLRN